MNKFNIGDKVKYNGPISFLSMYFNEMGSCLTVNKVVPNNSPIGNGETNKSGGYMYKVTRGETGTNYLFKEEELLTA